jgi:hypothetical protein
LDSTGSGQGPVAGCCECGDEPSASCATELVSYIILPQTLSQDLITSHCTCNYRLKAEKNQRVLQDPEKKQEKYIPSMLIIFLMLTLFHFENYSGTLKDVNY